MPAEVQVRTALQHAWAAIDHKLQYKQPQSRGLPANLQRDLFRLSALLELADKEFSALREATAETQEAYSDSVGGGELDIPLDSLSLDVYLDAQDHEGRWSERALSKGFMTPDWDESSGPETVTRNDRAYLLRVATAVGLETVAALDAVLKQTEEWGDRALDIYAESSKRQPGSPRPIAWPTDLLTVFLLMRFGIRADEIPDSQYENDPDPWHWGGRYLEAVNLAVASFQEAGS
jgi:hypothetical protein